MDEDLLAEMNEINERLATTWITVIAGALQKNGVLTTALSLTRQTVDGIQSTNTWLSELELEIPPPAVINSTSELSQTLRKLNALKNRVDLKTNEYKSFIEAGKTEKKKQLPCIVSFTERYNHRECGCGPSSCRRGNEG